GAMKLMEPTQEASHSAVARERRSVDVLRLDEETDEERIGEEVACRGREHRLDPFDPLGAAAAIRRELRRLVVPFAQADRLAGDVPLEPEVKHAEVPVVLKDTLEELDARGREMLAIDDEDDGVLAQKSDALLAKLARKPRARCGENRCELEALE